MMYLVGKYAHYNGKIKKIKNSNRNTLRTKFLLLQNWTDAALFFTIKSSVHVQRAGVTAAHTAVHPLCGLGLQSDVTKSYPDREGRV